MASRTRRTAHSTDIWPGFVDALATLLLVLIFLLVVFVLSEFFLSRALSGRDEALDRLNQQVAELADLLSLAKQANIQLRGDIPTSDHHDRPTDQTQEQGRPPEHDDRIADDAAGLDALGEAGSVGKRIEQRAPGRVHGQGRGAAGRRLEGRDRGDVLP